MDKQYAYQRRAAVSLAKLRVEEREVGPIESKLSKPAQHRQPVVGVLALSRDATGEIEVGLKDGSRNARFGSD
jgi:hypothetical protein